MKNILIHQIPQNLGQKVSIRGWVFNLRSSGGICFLQIRDGSGRLQAVVAKDEVPDQVWQASQKVTPESSVEVEGEVYEDKRSPYGWEMKVLGLKIIQAAQEFPLGKKEHGPEFLLDHRHLWLRSPRQEAILKIRDEVIWQIRKFFREQKFILTDSPVLTPTSCEGTTTLFSLDYFGKKAYLSQSGQLYLEALIYSLGRVYDFGPTFRAEKSKTRRHLTEFWMMNAEAAFMEHEENMKLQEDLISYVVPEVIKSQEKELKILERDLSPLKKVKPPFERITYDQAVKLVQKKGGKMKYGHDFGGDEETIISKSFENPVFIEKYPAKTKAFYMQPDPENPDLVLNDDLLAPEGYGEIIGGSQRVDDLKTLEKKLKEFKLPKKDFAWYLDLRKYGSVPHAGFGVGIERFIAWICGLKHIREAIPFPRLLNRLRP